MSRTLRLSSIGALLRSEGFRARLRGLAIFLALALALGLASYAQYTIGRPLPGWMSPFSRISEELVRIYGRPQSVLLASVLFGGAGLLFLIATRKRETSEAPDRFPILNARTLWRDGWGKLSLGLFLGGAALWSYLIARLWLGGYEEYYPYLFGLALAGLAAPFVRWDVAARIRVRFSLHWWELVIVAALTATFIILNVRDLDGWQYSFLGDEGAFFDTARLLGKGQTFNLFSQVGTYADQPLASSAYQAMVMKAFGFDYFGWKLASLLLIAATIPAFYFLVRTLFGFRPAVFGTAFLSASHYLFAYAHTGYHNVFPVFPAALAFVLFYAGLRSSSALLLFGSGIVSGFGFYTFYPARAIIVVLALFVFTLGFRRWRPGLVLPISLGFIFAVVPIFAVDKAEVINAMLGRSVQQVNDPLIERILDNVPRSLFAFNYSPAEGTYLASALMDSVTAVLAMLGLAYALYRIRSEPHRFVVIWFVVSVITMGLFSPHERVPITRYHVALLAMATFAGIAVDRILIVLEGLSPAKLKPLLVGAALMVLVPLVFALNIQIFWVDSPRGSPGHPITVAVRAVMETPCRGNGASNVIVSKDVSHFLEGVFRTYGMTDEQPSLLHYEETSSEMLGDAPCVVLMDPGLPAAQGLLGDLLQNDPARSVEELRDGSGTRRVLVVRSASYAQPVLQFAAALLPELINQEQADVNLDGEIDAVDAQLILQFEARLLDSLPVGG